MNEQESAAGDRDDAAGGTAPEATAKPKAGRPGGPWQDWVVTSDTHAAGEAGDTPADGEDPDEHEQAVSRWRRQSNKRNKKAKRPFWIELPVLVVVAFALTFLIQTFVAKVYYVPSGSMEQTLHGVPSGGDRILASKIVYDFRDPRQGDVVVFKGPDTWAPETAGVAGPTTWFGKAMSALGSVVGIAPPNEKDFVKRVIAVGGQTVACCDKTGNVTVDGKPLSEPYIYEPLDFEPGVADCTTGGDASSYASRRCFAPFKVPAGQLFVMGDHRSASADSSYECLGLKPAQAAAYVQPGGEKGCWRPIPVTDVIGKAIFIVMPPSRWRTIGDPNIDPQAMAIASGPTAALPAAGGILLTLGLRGSLAMVPSRRRRRKRRRQERKAARTA
ncbi:signal peptidase I [Nakamurella panacisegetis]|nr:signal peptidase I [Nakamurella panacisegetis]